MTTRGVVSHTRASRIVAKRDLLEQAARDWYATMTAADAPPGARTEALAGLTYAARAFVRAENGED